MKALIISIHYLDENLGGPNCSKAFIKALAAIYPGCTLIYPEHDDHVTDTSILDKCDVHLVPCPDHRPKIKKALDMYCGTLHRFTPYVKAELKKTHYDIVFINSSFIASSGVFEAVTATGCKIATLHHNVEKDYIKDNQQPLAFRYPYNHFFLKAEDKAVRGSDLNLTLTQADTNYFSSAYPDKKDTVETMGIFEYMDMQGRGLSTATGNTFVISGSLTAAQTEVAVMTFLADYMPILNRLCPDAKLIITGRNPSAKLAQACDAYPNISLVPNPDDILKVVVQGAYYIAPIYTGGGLKLRVMDPLRLGLPVLAHEVSARGYEPLIADGCMLSYNDTASFEQGVRRLLSLGVSHKDVADCYCRHFSFASGTERLKDILRRHGLI